MFKKLMICLGAVVLGQGAVQAQHRTCGTMNNLERLEKEHPGTKDRRAQAERAIQAWKPATKVGQKTSAAIITIPVVVHVVYRNANQNISQAQIQSQIDILNEDYSRKNADTINIPAAFKPLLGDMQVRFELAKRDPNGDPTTGITRTSTTVNSFVDDDAVKFNSRGGHNAWNRDKYLNIWVCPLGGGLLGYAQFPGSGPATTDGVVIGHNYFGRTGTATAPFNKGRTATHEVGHWLGLLHIWGDEPNCSADDSVADTPQQKGENYNCPTFPLISGTGASCTAAAPGAMFMNYMDYVDDACMNMFSVGQKNRAQAALNTSRPTLFTSDGLTPVVLQPLDAGVFDVLAPKAGNTCNTTITPRFVLKNQGTTTLTAATVMYKLDNNAPQTISFTGSLASLATTNVTLPVLNNLSAGAHTYQISVSLPNGQADNNTANDSKTVSFTVVPQPTGLALPFAESFEPTTFPPTDWTRNNPDNDITWARTFQAAKAGMRSAYMNNYDYSYIGEVDDLIMPALNLTTQPSPQLSFQVAYSPSSFSIASDTLEVLVSTDCGETYTSLYKKTGQALSTKATTTVSKFIPTTNDWRLETINLAAFASRNSVILKFRNTTNYENNLYIDDVQVGSPLGVKAEASATALNLFPNPANGLVTLQHGGLTAGTVTVTNAIGQEVLRQPLTSGAETVLLLTEKPAGIYLVKVIAGEKTYVQKLVLTN